LPKTQMKNGDLVTNLYYNL